MLSLSYYVKHPTTAVAGVISKSFCYAQQKKESFDSWKMHRDEIEKFRDPRRVAIANQYPLSKEQKEEIDELYITNYGEKIDYVWHQNFAAHAGRFDYRFFPELLYIPEFEAYQNQNMSAISMFGDKNFLPLVAKGVGIKMPRTIVDCTNGILRDGDSHIITPVMAKDLIKKLERPFFLKPSVDSSSGRGCIKVNDVNACEFSDNVLVVDGVRYSDNFVIQEVIECHESINKIYDGSVNTFRVISYIWKGKVELMPIIIRIGQGGSYVDNAHAGGIFCAVNNDGTMGDHAITEFNDQYISHPQSGIVFKNHKIRHMDCILESARTLHSAIPQLGCYNWDFTIDKGGDVILIEANCKKGSCWLPQMAHGVGAFGARTVEVLRWLRFMKQLKPRDRKFYSGGRMG